ncbi:sentrin-specific protease 7 isoform X3 [Gallus gallus]|uniref:Sentrin-specific protease 7 n=1 Tax=Gallus gallus TaxID=9031 RepID=A0A8V0XNV7_CHICK|nr:sentrin-specific protease 7 isoform X3 [Gallus gallus]XP_004938324.2 sentrin-specific protease 7 isoform X3 [Gallus gallus]XP_040561002.1 sentrin-specific protease 7 isoform X3 [Gallus gallus]XP_040561006.1 sentrin-specific protease 7 isoform X3 [Gallus gallus]
MEGRPSPSSHVSWRLSASNRETSTKGRRQRDCDRCSSNDEESIGQPKVILTNVLRTKIGRKYTQAQPKTDANFSDAGKLQSNQPPSSSVASLKIWQILNPALHSPFLSKRQPQVILTNVLRTRIGRKYVDSHILIDSNLSDAEKLQLGQLASSSVASAQTCQILSSPHESSFLSERSEHCLTKSDVNLSKESERGNVVLTFRRRKLEKKENKSSDELDKKRKNMNSTSSSWKGSSSLDSEKRKRRFSGHISDDCKERIPEKSLLRSKEQRLSSTRSSGCRTPCEDEQDHRSDLVQDSVAQTLERDCKDTPTNNQLRPAHSCSEEAGSDSAPSDLSEKQLIAVSPQVSTIRKVKTDTSQYLNKLRNRNCRSNRPLVSADPIVLSSDDEDRSSEPKEEEGLSEPKCMEQLQDNITDVQEIEQQSDVRFSEKLMEDNVESHTEQLLTKSDDDKCPTNLPSGNIHSEQMKPGLDFEFDSIYIGIFKWSSTGPVRFMTKYITIPFQVALNKNIKLTVDTLDVRRFGLWRNDGGCSSTTVIFIWLSVDYLEKIETQLGKRVSSEPSKCSEFIFLELSQPLPEQDVVRLSELITEISKKNRAPDLLELLSLKQALLLFKDLSPEESSFISSREDLLKQCATKESISFAQEPTFQKPKPKVARPSYALANKQNSGCYSISLSSAPNEEWKEVGESGAVKNLIVYPPPPAKGGLGVTREDLKCLEYGEFLNDVIIDFYLKYLLLEKAPKHLAERTHIFSSFFYKCLTRTEKFSEEDPKVSVAQRRHKRVRTWTRHINIFSKDYIFVPVNEESHWYMAVICFPWLEETVYEEHPHQNSLNLSPLQSENKSEDSVIGSVLAYPEEEMDANRILFSKGGNESAASASGLDSGISKISLNNSKRQVCKRPCILILDSLKAGSVQKTVQVLREYLEVEWEVKRKTRREFSKSTMIDFYPRVPKQDNSSDCGVYLLQYVESFFQNPIVDFEQPVHLEKWFPRQVIRSKREEIQDLILQLHFQQLRGSRS